MSKQRTFGDDVTVRLLSESGIKPFIIDFDSITFTSFSEGKSSKGVGQSITNHQSKLTGYEITLTRDKRDNYLQSLIFWDEQMKQQRLASPKFTIEHTTFHTYTALDINPLTELQGFGAVGVSNILDNLPGQVRQVLDKFKEQYLYKGCRIVKPSSGDKPKETNTETITLLSSYRVCTSDFNQMDDFYVLEGALEGLLKQIEKATSSKEVEVIKAVSNTVLNNIPGSLNPSTASFIQEILDKVNSI